MKRAPQDDGDEALEPSAVEGDLEPPPQDPEYRRRRTPVRVRRQRTAGWWHAWRRGWKPALAGTALLALLGGLYALVFQSQWFVLESSDQITLRGVVHTDPAAILGVFSSDLGRNVFFIPLSARRRAVNAIPWVADSAVLRLWPARLQVIVQERTPIALARRGEQLELIDAAGVLLPVPPGGKFDFAVLNGLTGLDGPDANRPEARRQRAQQLKLYTALRADLDRDGAHRSRDFSEIDVSDPSDLQAQVAAPGGGTVLIHFGDQNFGARYQLFLSQIAAWRQKYPAMVSVDLHFDGEAIVNPGTPPPPAASAAPGKPPAGNATHPPAPVKRLKPAARGAHPSAALWSAAAATECG